MSLLCSRSDLHTIYLASLPTEAHASKHLMHQDAFHGCTQQCNRRAAGQHKVVPLECLGLSGLPMVIPIILNSTVCIRSENAEASVHTRLWQAIEKVAKTFDFSPIYGAMYAPTAAHLVVTLTAMLNNVIASTAVHCYSPCGHTCLVC